MIWTQDENGEWNSDKDRQLGVPDTFYKIAIEEGATFIRLGHIISE